jgi:hypothetical protein
MTIKAAFHCTACFCLCICFGGVADAADRRFQHNINVFTQYTDAHFVELDDLGDPINEEEGSLLFSGVGFYWQFDSGLFTDISYSSASDNLTYRGLSQLGQFIESETEYFIRDAQILLGRNFGPTGAYLGLGSRFRERNILGTEDVLGLYEEMDVTYGLFGLRLNLFANRPFQLRLYGSIATDLQSELYIASESFDPLELEPGNHLIAEGSIEFLFHLFGGITLSVIPSYEFTHIDKSDSYRVYVNGEYRYDAVHPETEYETLSVKAKLSWYF